MQDHLVTPHGGKLLNLLIETDKAEEYKKIYKEIPSWDLTSRQLCDIELLLNGAFSPLKGFLNKNDYESVCTANTLSNGTLWPIPITLDVAEELAGQLKTGSKLALRDMEGVLIAILHVKDIWQPDKLLEAENVYGTTNPEHPGVYYLLYKTYPCYLGGTIEGIQLPEHYDFCELRLSPLELRNEFSRMGWRKIIAFQTRNPMHRAHFEMTLQAIRELEANLLIHPVVGLTKPGDIDHYTRVRCYQALLPHYPLHTAKISLLPLAMRMAGPREAVWHALIRKNYGCTHFIVGRDHAGPGNSSKGKSFYGHYDAQKLVKKLHKEIGVEIIPFKMMVYVPEKDIYEPENKISKGSRTLQISGTELRERLAKGLEIPSWYTFPEVSEELCRTHPPRYKQGFTVFFTGLSGAGKSTLAKALQIKLLEMGGRPVTLLDGDIVRKNLSSELGFTKEHRDLNIKRIGFVAAEITKNGGIAICAPIAPYDKVRKEVRAIIEKVGGFILIYIATPLAVCEKRDRKGLYAKARAGLIKQFTGISDPYEAPSDADLIINTTDVKPEEAAQEILLKLEHDLYINGNI